MVLWNDWSNIRLRLSAYKTPEQCKFYLRTFGSDDVLDSHSASFDFCLLLLLFVEQPVNEWKYKTEL